MNTLCWICGAGSREIREATAVLNTDSIKITDDRYGYTLAIRECLSCGFQFCPDTEGLVEAYVNLEDGEYEFTRAPRLRQAADLLRQIKSTCPLSGSLLDVGAGSGILLEAATAQGLESVGVEPSAWLAEQGRNRGLDVRACLLEEQKDLRDFNFATLVDVIEHVDDPIKLLRDTHAALADHGLLLLVTPDRGSFFARLLGFNWWHYRVAHVCYFDKNTLSDALEKVGFEVIHRFHPRWYFRLDYLISRIGTYIPFAPKVLFGRTADVIVPLNLFDSIGVIARKK
jgi:2-polyprenyl-3-methyl-5-hydroxy-6-metoxy-1,4-benzoquinol methylase